MKIPAYLAAAPIADALSVIHDVIRSLEFRFDRERFDKLIKSQYPGANDSSIRELAAQIRNEFEAEAGSDLNDLPDDEKNRLTVELAAVAQALARKSFGPDSGNAAATLEAFRKERF